MSLATNQAMVILTIATACMKIVRSNGLSQDIEPTVLYCEEMCFVALSRWPETGDESKNKEWQRKKIREAWLSMHLLKKDPLFVELSFVQLAFQVIEDLYAKVGSGFKKELLDPIIEAMKGISDVLDKDGDEWTVYAGAKELLTDLYLTIDFKLE